MDENSTTGAANNQGDAISTTTTDSNATTDNIQTGQGADNLDSSKTTDTSAADKSTNDGGNNNAPATFDNDLDDWAVKRTGRKPETDDERQKLQDLRNEQREFTKARQSQTAKKQAQDLTSAIKTANPDDNVDDDDADPLEKRVTQAEQALRDEREMRMRTEYINENSVTTEEVKAMDEFLQEKLDRAGTPEAKLTAFNYWTDPANLSEWHALGKTRLSAATANQTATEIETKARTDERERIAREHQANGPDKSASNVSTKTGDERHQQLMNRWKKK